MRTLIKGWTELGSSPSGMTGALQYFLVVLVVVFSTTYASAEVDRVLVNKNDRLLYLMSGAEVVRQYDISLGENPIGHKLKEGDEKTPEGSYFLDWKNADSSYFKSIRISYPNQKDEAQAKAGGYSPGGNIFIHGLPNKTRSHRSHFIGRDWTDGCIAVNDNVQMSEIWRLLKIGIPIEIIQ